MTDSTAAPPPATPGSPTSLEHLAALRAEVARLEAELGVPSSAAARAGSTAPSPPTAHGVGSWWRGPVVVVCLVLAAVLAPLALVATWAHDEVSDTDRYVETVAPLADNADVQRAVSARISDELLSRLDVKAVTDEAVDALAARGLNDRVATSLQSLGTPLASAIENFVDTQVERVVASDAFTDAWVEVNREAHDQMVAVLTGETGGAVEVEGSAVKLNLAALIDGVKQRLLDAGFALAERIPEVQATFTLFESPDLAKAQTLFRVLDALARALPIAALILFVVAVLVARRHRRTLVAGALVIAGSMLALGLALNAFRVFYLDAVPTDQLPADAAGAIYDQLVNFIRLNLRAVLVLFLAIAAVAWVSGSDPAPVAVRRGATRAFDAVRHGSDRAGLGTGRVGEFLGRYRGPIRALVAGVVVLVYVLTDHPTGGSTLTLLAVAALVLIVVEVLAREPATPETTAASDSPPAGDPVASPNDAPAETASLVGPTQR